PNQYGAISVESDNQRLRRVNVVNNVISNVPIGIQTSGGIRDILVEGNVVGSTTSDGLRIWGGDLTGENSRNINIKNNVVRDAGRHGIYARVLGQPTIIGNSVRNSLSDNLHIEGIEFPTIVGNTLSGSKANGLVINGSSSIVVTGNTISENARYGVELGYFGTFNKATFTGNLFEKNNLGHVGSTWHESSSIPLQQTYSGNTNVADVVFPQSIKINYDESINPAKADIVPQSSLIYVKCDDADGCDITISEQGISIGQLLEIINTGINKITLIDSTGVVELPKQKIGLGQYDSLTLRYISDRWVLISSSDN
ncbi:right-handed parallel beta-helix repeat-containing protein, partial [Candidatus Woesearchaeota archaeon]|nr:right-handed parallel beta-helix repeat-containing protein [Candidatus Woesearchaeota archaeon]